MYAAEEAIAIGKKFHQACFTCKTCKKGLDSNNLADGDDEIYCKNCHLKMYGPKGFRGGGGGVNSTTGIKDEVKVVQSTTTVSGSSSSGGGGGGGGPKFCPECGAKNPGKFCSECGAKTGGSSTSSTSSTTTSSSSSNVSTASGGSLASRSAAFSGGAASSSSSGSIDAKGYQPKKVAMKFGGAPKCGACGTSVYPAEEVKAAGGSFHQACFRCMECKKGLMSNTMRDNSEGKIFCNSCHSKLFGPKGFGIGGGATHTQ